MSHQLFAPGNDDAEEADSSEGSRHQRFRFGGRTVVVEFAFPRVRDMMRLDTTWMPHLGFSVAVHIAVLIAALATSALHDTRQSGADVSDIASQNSAPTAQSTPSVWGDAAKVEARVRGTRVAPQQAMAAPKTRKKRSDREIALSAGIASTLQTRRDPSHLRYAVHALADVEPYPSPGAHRAVSNLGRAVDCRPPTSLGLSRTRGANADSAKPAPLRFDAVVVSGELDDALVVRRARASRRALRRCIEQPNVHAEQGVEVRLMVADGRMVWTRVGGSSDHDANACIRDVVGGWRFPPDSTPSTATLTLRTIEPADAR